jgi:hypothetical protein
MNAQNTAAAMQNARGLSPQAQARQAKEQARALAAQAAENQQMFGIGGQGVPLNPGNFNSQMKGVTDQNARDLAQQDAGATSLYGDVAARKPPLEVVAQPTQRSSDLMHSDQPEFLNDQAALAGAEATTNRGISRAPDGGASQGEFLLRQTPSEVLNLVNAPGVAGTVGRNPNTGRPEGQALPVDYDTIGAAMDAAHRRDLQLNGIPGGVTGDRSWQRVMPPDSMGALADAANPLGMPLPVDAPPPVRGRRRR